jgi:hypothetical protein
MGSNLTPFLRRNSGEVHGLPLFPAQLAQPHPGVDLINDRILGPCSHVFSLLSRTTDEPDLLANFQGSLGAISCLKALF